MKNANGVEIYENLKEIVNHEHSKRDKFCKIKTKL